MTEPNGKLVGLIVALASSLKGVSEVVTSFRKHHYVGKPEQELLDSISKLERELYGVTAELAACVGAKLDEL